MGLPAASRTERGKPLAKRLIRLEKPAFAPRRTPAFVVWALAAILAVALPAIPARADFDSGVRAYDAGDYEAAFQIWLPLARDGDSFAQRNLGHLYRLGRGVPQDFGVAANWYRRASDQGLVRAQANLANMYLRGQGVEQDTERAAAWFHRAAVAGHTISQFNIGLLFDKGLGVQRDPAKAMGWFLAASEGGHEKARELLEAYRSEGVKPAPPETLRNEPELAEAINAPPGPVAALPRAVEESPAPRAPTASERAAARPGPAPAPRAAAAPAPAPAPAGRAQAAPPTRAAATNPDDDESDDPFAGRAPAAAPVPRAAPPAPATAAAAPAASAAPRTPPAAAAAGNDDDPFGENETRPAAPSARTAQPAASAPSAAISAEGRDTLGGDEPAPAAPAARSPATPAASPAPTAPGPVASLPAPTSPAPAVAPPVSAEQQAAVDLGLEAYRGRDYAGALRIWRPLAETGNRDAQFYLGGLYMDGSGVPADVVQAHVWWRLASEKGHAKAKEFVDLIESIMTPEERNKARDLAADLRRAAIR
jgi:TPR repeat protein